MGGIVTIAGTNLQYVDSIRINGATAGAPTAQTATQIEGRRPGRGTAPTGKIEVSNAASGGIYTVSTSTFKVLPKIDSFTPPDGCEPGCAVTINGSGFGTAAPTVKFNGVAGPVEAGSSDTVINTHLPASATTGAVTITTLGGTATGAVFKVAPSITQVSPSSATTGQVVTITGTTLTGVTSVGFNGVTATLGTKTATTVTATVPATATSGPLTSRPREDPASTAFTVLPKITTFSPTTGTTGQPYHHG